MKVTSSKQSVYKPAKGKLSESKPAKPAKAKPAKADKSKDLDSMNIRVEDWTSPRGEVIPMLKITRNENDRFPFINLSVAKAKVLLLDESFRQRCIEALEEAGA